MVPAGDRSSTVTVTGRGDSFVTRTPCSDRSPANSGGTVSRAARTRATFRRASTPFSTTRMSIT